MRNGYEETIQRGLAAVHTVGRLIGSDGNAQEGIAQLRRALHFADAVVIGAGAGMSTSAGFTYGGARFMRWFSDFFARFGFRDMYSGGFYDFPDAGTKWAFWARMIYVNRYMPAAKPVYEALLDLVRDKDYFVITTNVDHLFQRAGFDKRRLFCTQGDYGLFQHADPADGRTYDNEAWVMDAMRAMGYVMGDDGLFAPPVGGKVSMRLPDALIPHLPDGSEPVMNLRGDDSFVQDTLWHAASEAYAEFLDKCEGKRVLYLELGVGGNTPVIIKFPFWQMVRDNENAVYACVNMGEACAPEAIAGRSILLDMDIGEALEGVKNMQPGQEILCPAKKA